MAKEDYYERFLKAAVQVRGLCRQVTSLECQNLELAFNLDELQKEIKRRDNLTLAENKQLLIDRRIAELENMLTIARQEINRTLDDNKNLIHKLIQKDEKFIRSVKPAGPCQ